MRDIQAHDDADVNMATMRRAVEVDLPALVESIRQLRPDSSS